MISTPIRNGQIDYTFFTKEESLSLSKIRIIKKNLVHVHGFPLSIAKVSILKKKEYFGQYGKIQRILLNHKINPETNKKLFSVYITYSNEKEASFAILSVDSLLIEGKIIRAFFGTTKYCNYFLNNISCPNMDKCLFLHKLVKDKDIIIDSNTLFSYNEHLNLAKKIIQFSNPETQNLVKSMPKIEKTFFPNIDFIYLNEKDKINYLHSSVISYINGNTDNDEKNIKLPNLGRNNISNKSVNSDVYKNNIDHLNKNNVNNNFSFNCINNNNRVNIVNSPITGEKNHVIIHPNEPSNLHNIFKNSIEHILLVKPFFLILENNIPLKEMEFNYFKEELKKSGINIYTLLDGCLDNINFI